MADDWCPNDTVRALRRGAHIVEPTEANVERLWRYYQRSYRDDNELLARTCDPQSGIDGLTEPLTMADIGHTMRMPDTVTFEAGTAEEGACRGFVTVRYATGEPGSRDRFRDYFLGEVFQRDALRFASDASKAAFFQAIDEGRVLYFAELVSKEGREASAALIFATYQEICLQRIGLPSTTVVGKCLDTVRIGSATNTKGNRPVKALAEALGLEKIAVAEQVRRLHVTAGFDLLIQALAAAAAGPTADVDAILSFGLYVGKADAIVRRMATRL